MMLNSNKKVNVHSPEGETEFFYIVPEVLQGDTLAPFRKRTKNAEWSNKRKWLYIKIKAVSRWYPLETISD